MSRNYPQKNDKNDSPLEYHSELLNCLSRINTYNPPVHTCSTSWSSTGLYKGPLSIAYLFYRLSQHYAFDFKSQSLTEWAEDYLRLSTGAARRPIKPSSCGVANEHLAYLTVAAVLNNDQSLVRQLCSYQSEICAGEGSNGWLYGRAGYLYLLRVCRAHATFGKADLTSLIDNSINRTIARILESSWMWHGKEYLGAVHGWAGIISQVVGSIAVAHDIASIPHEIIRRLTTVLDLQSESGSFPTSLEARSNDLVQFCHGGPGITLCLQQVKESLGQVQEKIDNAVDRAQIDTWNRGLLRKAPSLCHGIAGNALVFQDERFFTFLGLMTTAQLEENKTWMADAGVTDEFVGLFTGEAGRAWLWAIADLGLPRKMIGFNDV